MPSFKDTNHCGPVPINYVLLRMGINEGRPKRDDVISKDEIMNLRILLNVTKSVDAFLQKI